METTNYSDLLLWYVIHTNQKQEDRAVQNLSILGINTLNPKIKERRYNSFTGLPIILKSPLFPGYIFARFKINELFHKIRYTRGIREVVNINGTPIPIEEKVMALIQSKINNDGLVDISEEPKPGDKVKVMTGPFKDFTGLFENRVNAGERIRILLENVNYQVRVEINSDIVEKL